MIRRVELPAASRATEGLVETIGNSTFTSSPFFVRASVGCILLIALALRVYWVFLIPYNDAPDEYCHHPMAAYLAAHGHPPTMADVPKVIPVSYAAMSPLGYVPQALAMATLGPKHPWAYLAARLGSAILGTTTVLLLFLATRELAPDQPIVAILVAWLACLHPQMAFTSGYINNDAAMLTVTAAVWYLWMRMARRGATIARWVAMGAVAALASLCKPNAAAVILAGLPIVWTHLRFGGGSLSRRFLGPALAAVAAVATVAPWCAWSWTHHRSLFGLEIHRTWWRNFVEEAGIKQGYLSLDEFDEFFVTTVESFWGWFGFATTPLDVEEYWIIHTVLFAGALLAILQWIAKRSIHSSRHESGRSTELTRADRFQRAAWWSLLTGVSLAWLLHIYHSTQYGLAAHGRYILPVAWPLYVVIAFGFGSLRWGRMLPLAGSAVVIVAFLWVQSAAVMDERRSNRFRQTDKRVRCRLVGLACEPPGRRPFLLPEYEPLGEPLVFDDEFKTCVVVANREEGFRLLPEVRIADLTKASIEERWVGGIPDEGQLILRNTSTGKIVDVFRYENPCKGLARFEFDLKRTGASPDETVWIELHPNGTQSQVAWRTIDVAGVTDRPADRTVHRSVQRERLHGPFGEVSDW